MNQTLHPSFEFSKRLQRRVTAIFPLTISLSIAVLNFGSIANHAAGGAMLLHIEATTPRVAQRGTTVEVTIQGICLKDAREIVFYRPGIRSVSIEA